MPFVFGMSKRMVTAHRTRYLVKVIVKNFHGYKFLVGLGQRVSVSVSILLVRGLLCQGSVCRSRGLARVLVFGGCECSVLDGGTEVKQQELVSKG